MNMNKLAKEISKREGGKQNLSIAQIKEVLGHVADMITVPEILCSFILYGVRRKKNKPKKGK